MAPVVTEKEEEVSSGSSQPVVNDVVIRVATANGSGSQSANLILMHSIFGMGIPVSGKNRFPSNIEGLPTWFTIRANKDRWLAQTANWDFLVAMNDESVDEDLESLRPGTFVVLNDALKHHVKRDDLVIYEVPFNRIVQELSVDTRLRKKIVNVIYVGVLAFLLKIEMDEIMRAIDKQFGAKPKAAAMNRDAAQAGYDWAEENLTPQNTFYLERANLTEGKILIEGNEATAMGLMFGGLSVLAWYPITPSSSVCETLMDLLSEYRRDPETGDASYAVVQAEDEIASIGVVLGAGWVGARAATATSGPGLSLMAEMAGLSYFAEIPAVIVDVQRMGPSTGLPTRTAQGDVLSAYYLSHGDCKHVLLFPGNVEECYEFGMKALDLSNELQTLVLVMTDLDLGMNRWMSDPFKPPTEPLKRGKVLSADDLDRLNGKFQRYADVDGDGIPYRTLPGTDHPNAAYFTRGTGHTAAADYSEKAVNWKANIDRLVRKFDTARNMVPKPVVDNGNDSDIGFIAFGSTDSALQEARHVIRKRYGVEPNYLRLRALPANGDVTKFLEDHRVVYVVEQNRDAQMASLLRSEFPQSAHKLRSILHYNGRCIDAESIVSQFAQLELGKKQ